MAGSVVVSVAELIHADFKQAVAVGRLHLDSGPAKVEQLDHVDRQGALARVLVDDEVEAECLSHDLCGALGSCVESLLNELLVVHVHSDRRLQPLLDRSQGKLESLEQSLAAARDVAAQRCELRVGGLGAPICTQPWVDPAV